ncbi:hypothetical protein LSH36_368g01072 [Paralvinella palmiformis]|uniref:Protein JTB n=1 Tax=Paralvinella palmiformis TaxID=53620 RepID=A0AAD9JF75_9ANNE|nr:hypothetical protein LSH36_368g01072 [Paralvinella palmiformis]
MIEFCTKRRMIVAIAGLIVVSVVVLLVENHMSPSHSVLDLSSKSSTGNATYHCWEVAKTVIVTEECSPCTVFEQKTNIACKDTGYTERVKCILKDDTESSLPRSCPKITWVEEKHFWLFEVLMALLGFGSYSIVHSRQRRLDRLLLEKVNRQIATGV